MTPRLALEMRAYRNARYHEDRQAFFETANRWANFAVVMLGTSAAATALSAHPVAAAVTSGLTAFAGAIQLVFDVSGQARTHLELRRSFLRIMAAASRPGTDLDALNADMVGLYEAEPDLFHATNALAYNAAQTAFGREPGNLIPVSGLQRLLRHLRHFDPSQFGGKAVA